MRFRFIRVVLVVALIGATAGCGYAERREAESVASQEAQMKELAAQIKQWGEDILAQIPEDEIEETLVQPGSRKLSDYFEPWPQYRFWEATVRLRPEETHTPLQMADELEPWLLSEGWQRSDGGRDDVAKTYVRRSYSREGYRLSVRVTRKVPPYAQNLDIGLVSPPTKP